MSIDHVQVMSEWQRGEKTAREILDTLLLRAKHIHAEVKTLNEELELTCLEIAEVVKTSEKVRS